MAQKRIKEFALGTINDNDVLIADETGVGGITKTTTSGSFKKQIIASPMNVYQKRTGVLGSGADCVINAGSNNLYDINFGELRFVNEYTDPNNITLQDYIFNGVQGIAPNLLGAAPFCDIRIGLTANVLPGEHNPAEAVFITEIPNSIFSIREDVKGRDVFEIKRNWIYLSRLNLQAITFIVAINNDPKQILSNIYSEIDELQVDGPKLKSGLVVTPTLAGANLSISAGEVFKYNVNFSADAKNPNISTIPEQSPAPSVKGWRNPASADFPLQSGLPALPTLPTDLYDPNGDGILVAIPSGEFVIHDLYVFPSDKVYAIAYAQKSYATLDEAKTNAFFDKPINIGPSLINEALFLGKAIVQQGATDFVVNTNYFFIELGATSGGGGGGAIDISPELNSLEQNLKYINSTLPNGFSSANWGFDASIGVGKIYIDSFVTRASAHTYFDNYGLLKTSGNNTIDYDYSNGKPAILVYQQSTNLCTNSNDFAVDWNEGNTTINTDAQTGLDGLVNADTIVENTANSVHRIFRAFTINANTHTFSIFVKPIGNRNLQIKFGGNSAIFILTGEGSISNIVGTNVNPKINKIGSQGFFRCEISLLCSATETIELWLYNNATSYVGDGTSGLVISGGQLEELPIATPYIPAGASATIRLATDISIPFSEFYNKDEGTLIFRGWTNSQQTGQFARAIEMSDNTANNRLAILRESDTLRVFNRSAGVGQVDIILTPYEKNENNIIAISYADGGDHYLAGNSVDVVTQSEKKSPNINTIKIGNGVFTAYWNGGIEAVYYIPHRITDAGFLRQLCENTTDIVGDTSRFTTAFIDTIEGNDIDSNLNINANNITLDNTNLTYFGNIKLSAGGLYTGIDGLDTTRTLARVGATDYYLAGDNISVNIATGNIGIGGDSGSEKLQVENSANNASTKIVVNSSGNGGSESSAVVLTAGSTSWQLQTGDNLVGTIRLYDLIANADRFSINSAGVVNIPNTIISIGTYSNDVGTPTRDLLVDSSGNIGYQASLRETKYNINYEQNYDWIYDLRPVSFFYKQDTAGKYLQFGLVAEDVADVNQDVCYFKEIREEIEVLNEHGEKVIEYGDVIDTKLEGVNYKMLITPILAELQKLRQELNELKNK